MTKVRLPRKIKITLKDDFKDDFCLKGRICMKRKTRGS